MSDRSRDTAARRQTPHPALRRSFWYCHRLVLRASSSFWLAIVFLDRDTRRDLHALYAFCRTADDIADSTLLSGPHKVARLKSMRQAILTNKPSTIQPLIWPAVFDTMRRHKLPKTEILTILDGVASDVRFVQPASYSELDRYCYQVAGVVGVLSARILGAYKPSTLEGARQLGIAMQYTNIIRDIEADRALGRVYVPLSLLRKHGLTPYEMSRGQNQAGLKQTLDTMARRAKTFFEHSYPAIADLHPSYQPTVRIAYQLYYTLLERMKQKQYNVREERIRHSSRQKIRIAWRSYRQKT